MPQNMKQVISKIFIIFSILFFCIISVNLFLVFSNQYIVSLYNSYENDFIQTRNNINYINGNFKELLFDNTKDNFVDILKSAEKCLVATGNIPIKENKETIYKYMKSYISSMQALYAEYKVNPVEITSSIVFKKYNSDFNNLMKPLNILDKKYKESISKRSSLVKNISIIINIFFIGVFLSGIYLIYYYITVVKSDKSTLEKVRKNLKTLLDSLDSSLITVNNKGIILQLNATAQNSFNVIENKVYGKKVWDVIPSLKKYQDQIQRVAYSKKSEKYYKERIFSNSTRYYNIMIHYSYDMDNVLLKVDDITDLELQNDRTIQYQRMKTVENLIEGMTNSFNNVLGAIKGTISTMRLYLSNNSDSELLNNINLIDDSTEKIEKLINQLLSFTMRKEAVLSPVDLTSLLEYIYEICVNSFDKRINIEKNFINTPAIIKADTALIEQALMSICENAADSMTIMKDDKEKFGGNILISIERLITDSILKKIQPKAVDKAYWVIKIKDTGVGITDNDIEEIFEPFYTTKLEERCVGLGLPVANDVIIKHNGFLEIDSKIGKGTEVRIYIPIADDDPKTVVNKGKSKLASVKKEIPMGTGNILVVDDESVMLRTAKILLEKLGYKVFEADNAPLGVEIFNEKYEDIDLVILDYEMPEMSGREVYIQMKKMNPNLKVLLTTGYEEDSTKIINTLAEGVDSYIKKPYSIETLGNSVKDLLMKEKIKQ